jgi:hypothetical protein
VAIIKLQLQRVVTHGLDVADIHPNLPVLQHLLSRPMTHDLRRGGVNTQVFAAQAMGFTVIVAKLQLPGTAMQLDMGGCLHGTHLQDEARQVFVRAEFLELAIHKGGIDIEGRIIEPGIGGLKGGILQQALHDGV